MEEKILMRIHDDENDCDLVSVKNPLGHFGMSIFAEKNGARKPVDGMHMLSKMIEQVGNGGGWPADLPKPSVGGYGYTEQGEQTVITWDGDTSGKEHFESEGAVLYKVANVPQYFDKDSVSKITETTGETDFSVLDMSEMAGVIAFSYNNSKMLLMVVVDYEKANTVFPDAALTVNGVFFAVNGDVYTTSITYGTPDTIHKIDEKYLPSSGGGAMVVNITFDEDSGYYVADKTYDEIMDAIETGTVVKCIIYYAGKNFVLDLHSYDIRIK